MVNKQIKSIPMKSKINSYLDACELLKRDPQSRPDVSGVIEEDLKKYINANFELVIITKARNLEYSQSQGLEKAWRPDYTNRSEGKYTPWFEVDKSGSGFSYSDCDGWLTHTFVGSRLCFPTADMAIDMANDFKPLHLINQLFTD